MEIDIQTTITKYVRLLEQIKERTGDNADAAAILAEIRRDQRMRQTQQKTVIRSDMPATEKQIGYLERLGAQIPEGLTRQQASMLIDEMKETANCGATAQIPMRTA